VRRSFSGDGGLRGKIRGIERGRPLPDLSKTKVVGLKKKARKILLELQLGKKQGGGQ